MVIRVRPPLPREVEGERMFQNIVSVDRDEHVITISENLNAVLDEVLRRERNSRAPLQHDILLYVSLRVRPYL